MRLRDQDLSGRNHDNHPPDRSNRELLWLSRHDDSSQAPTTSECSFLHTRRSSHGLAQVQGRSLMKSSTSLGLDSTPEFYYKTATCYMRTGIESVMRYERRSDLPGCTPFPHNPQMEYC